MFKKLLAATFGLLALGAVAATANAAPLTGANGLLAAKTETSNVVLVHGRHSACKRDRRGWHRSYRRGTRTACRAGIRRGHRHHHRHYRKNHKKYHHHHQRRHHRH